MLVDISDIKKDLNEEEKEIFDKVINAMNTKSVTVKMLDLAFAVILLYVLKDLSFSLYQCFEEHLIVSH